MLLLAAGSEDPDPLGHVLDRGLIGGHHPVIPGTEDIMVFGGPLLTMHMVTLVLATLLLLWVMNIAAKAIGTGPESEGNDRYLTRGHFGQVIEVMVIYLRDNVVKPVLGEKTNGYLPFLLTVFFFVLMNNVLGLIPLLDLQHLIGGLFFGDIHFAAVGGTATGNLAVTGGLALIAFVVIQVHGLRELGLGGWLHHLLGGAPIYLAIIMVPIELAGMFIKPGALAIRLFANMMAGHILMATLALFGLMAYRGLGTGGAVGITLISGAFSVAITFLEVFVAFLQAFIFMFLTAVFIGQLMHHDDHAHDHAEAGAAHA